MIDGLSNDSSLISIDNNPELISIANEFFGEIENVDVI
jgi:predicted O-methyltransferase YrrM